MQSTTLSVPQRKKRHFIPDNFDTESHPFVSWEDVRPFYEHLKNQSVDSVAELRNWFLNRSELESFLSENFAWRYIRTTCDTANPEFTQQLNFFITEVQPQMTAYGNELDQKALASPYLGELSDAGFDVLIRGMRKAVEIFREENIPLNTEIQTEERKYGAIAGAMVVVIDGEEMTLQRAADRLQSPDRAVREVAYRKIQERRYQDKDALDELFNKLIRLRDRVARNAGFANFRDYMFAALGRFDYTPEDTFAFHRAVSQAVVPLLDELARKRKQALQVEVLRPWDLRVDVSNLPALRPFHNGEELLDKTIECFTRLHPFLGECLAIMKEMGHLDLESRKGKAPGGYNYPLDEIGVPFIFMNATTNLRDLVTLLHEGGHAVHSFLTRDLTLSAFKHPPSEVAELASMAMELLTMDHWDLFFESPADLRRAKVQHLEQIIETLPWVATVDKFQHWVYEHPEHGVEDRKQAWNETYGQFTDRVTDWTGLENYRAYLWQKQLHLYEVPFYYVEYGIAQLGAVAIWKNYKENPEQGLEGYLEALKLGYTRPIREIYAAAHIRFDFSHAYITELMQFVKEELKRMDN